MMKRWIATMLITVLLLSLGVLPTAAAYKEVNNDRLSADPSLLDDCDDADGWIASAGVDVAFDRDVSSAGRGSVRFVTDMPAYSNANLDIRGAFDWVDIHDADYVTFDLYLSNPELIFSTYQITVAIASGGISSQHTWEWKAAMFMNEYVEGWNTVKLPLANAQTKNADLDSIDNFRIYFHTINMTEDVSDMTLRIDNIEAHTYGTKARPMVDCDTADNWGGGVAGIETSNHVQGEGALVFHVTPMTVEEGDHSLVKQIVFPTPFNGANADYLEFDLYVSDAAALAEDQSNYGLQIEITSAGRCDAEELEWELQAGCGILKDGWNHVRLPIPKGGTANIDMRRINFFRLHLLNLKSCRDDLLVVMLDNVYLSFFDDNVDDYAPVEQPTEPPAPIEPPTPTEPGQEGGDAPTENPNENPVQDPSQNPNQESGSNTENTGDPTVGEQDDTSAAETLAARKVLTATRTKIVIILFAFFILGADIVVVAIRRREGDASLTPAEDSEQLVQALEAAEQTADPSTASDAEGKS